MNVSELYYNYIGMTLQELIHTATTPQVDLFKVEHTKCECFSRSCGSTKSLRSLANLVVELSHSEGNDISIYDLASLQRNSNRSSQSKHAKFDSHIFSVYNMLEGIIPTNEDVLNPLTENSHAVIND